MDSYGTIMFQSSPALSGRCNLVYDGNEPVAIAFQSSPALSGRCNVNIYDGHLTVLVVSILTGPFGPVQRGE